MFCESYCLEALKVPRSGPRDPLAVTPLLRVHFPPSQLSSSLSLITHSQSVPWKGVARCLIYVCLSLLWGCFKTVSNLGCPQTCYVAGRSLKSQFSCLCLPSAGITGTRGHHRLLWDYVPDTGIASLSKPAAGSSTQSSCGQSGLLLLCGGTA